MSEVNQDRKLTYDDLIEGQEYLLSEIRHLPGWIKNAWHSESRKAALKYCTYKVIFVNSGNPTKNIVLETYIFSPESHSYLVLMGGYCDNL